MRKPTFPEILSGIAAVALWLAVILKAATCWN